MGKVLKAEEVVLQLNCRLYWAAFEPGYRDSWDSPQFHTPQFREQWRKKKERIISSIERRAKYGPLRGKVVANTHLGILSSEVIYEVGRTFGDCPYEVVYTKPEGEVRITENTKLTIKMYEQ